MAVRNSIQADSRHDALPFTSKFDRPYWLKVPKGFPPRVAPNDDVLVEPNRAAKLGNIVLISGRFAIFDGTQQAIDGVVTMIGTDLCQAPKRRLIINKGKP